MRKLNLILLFTGLLFAAVSCSDSNNEIVPPPTPGVEDDPQQKVDEPNALQKTLAGNYWQEKTYPIVLENGKPVVSKESTMEALQTANDPDKKYPAFDENLGVFYVRADYAIRKYTPVSDENWRVLVLPNCYSCDFGRSTENNSDNGNRSETTASEELTVRLTALRDVLKNGWFAGEELKVVTLEEDRIVLESAIKEYTRKELDLGEEVVGLYTIWKMIKDPGNANRWGGDLRNAQTLTGY